jgi:hypothetical protein
MKCLCFECSSNLLKEKSKESKYLCKICNTISCENCLEIVKCSSCSNNICRNHSVRCQICDKRVCKEILCINSLKSCEQCKYLFCTSHLKDHAEFNKKDIHNIKCNATKFKNITGSKHISMDELCKSVRNIGFLTEVSFRIMFIRKQRVWRSRNENSCICHPIHTSSKIFILMYPHHQIKIISLVLE